ncbi:MAG: hypothetical protein KKF56_05195 [Nanoarchaeota archaeon]|nr:hypothetical protein [Nanoarchaeota archaeon]
MRLIQQIMEKKINLFQEHMLNRNYSRGIWNFYCCYNISVSVLNANVESRGINKLWRKFLVSDKFDEKRFNKIRQHMKVDMKLIIQALKVITQQTEDLGFDVGDIYRKATIGMLGYEYPE